MEFVFWAFAILLAVILLLTVIGLCLPKGHRVSSRAKYRQSPESLWQVLTDYGSRPNWCPGVKKVEKFPSNDGRLVWKEFWKFGPMTFEQMEAIAPKRLVIRIADPNLPFGGSWAYDFTSAEGGGTWVAITEDGEVRKPVFRVFSRMTSQHATMEMLLKALGKKFGEDVVPEKVF